jgi:hypothetical protein
MIEHTLTKTDTGYTIAVPVEDYLTVVWNIEIGDAYELTIRCHTVDRHGIANDDGLAVLPVDAKSVRLEAL